MSSPLIWFIRIGHPHGEAFGKARNVCLDVGDLSFQETLENRPENNGRTFVDAPSVPFSQPHNSPSGESKPRFRLVNLYVTNLNMTNIYVTEFW
jgi:hypothetical protein